MQRGISYDDAKGRIDLTCSQNKRHGHTEGWEFYRCPCKYLHPAAGPLITAANLMKQGCLPFEGGYMDQPAGVMEAISIVQRFLHEQEEKERELQTKKAPAKKGPSKR